MTTIGAYEAKTHLSELLERASAGEEFIIAKHGHALARLVPADQTAASVSGTIDAIIDARASFELRGDLRKHIEEGRRA
jgi:prevent-host-death family protein